MELPPARLHQLDGLRALAVVAVVMHHIGAASAARTLIQHGHHYVGNLVSSSTASGVELFFTLSGVVLLRPYLRQGRPMKAGVYLQRRVQRLWPPFLAAWLVAGFVIWLAGRYPTDWTKTADLAVFSVGSWLSQLGIVYVGSNAFNPAWWSLTVELLFYALVPVIVVSFTRLKPTRRQLVGAWVVSVAVAVLAQWASWSFLPARAWPIPRLAMYASCFATGIWIAAYDPRIGWAKWLLLSGALYVLVGCASSKVNLHVGWGLIYFALVVAALDSGSWLARSLSSWPLVWLGERSYSLFLVHISIFNLVNHLVTLFVPGKGAAYYLISRAIELPLALFASMVIFTVVERRFAHSLVSADAFWPTLSKPRPQAAAAELQLP